MNDTEKLRERNLTFFEELNPGLAKELQSYEPMSELIFDEDGEPDILFEGMKLYGKGARKYTDEHLKEFWDSPDIVQFSRKTVENMESEGTKLVRGVEEFAEANGITFNDFRTTKTAFHCIVLGLGLGYHIKSLLEDVRPRNLMLVEPNFEFLYQSLSTLDWRDLLEDYIQNGGHISILADRKTEVLLNEIRRLYSENGRASFDGTTVYMHYDSPVFEAIRTFIATEGDMLFSGLGFFEDEINMIANTYNNLKNGEEKVFFAHLDRIDIPVFVIGSGPSLDSCLEVIKANQDKAVIISCGTALLPLLRGGIQPDFHVELERGKVQIEIPQFVAQEHDLSDVCLIGSTTLVPGVKDVFPKRVYYFRHMLSSFPAFSNNFRNCLRFPSPTVGNTGVSFAQDTGFREYYFFGLDMGFIDPVMHHSANSIYMESGTKHSAGKGEARDWEQVVRGNFGGEVKTLHAMQWTRDTIQVSIANSSLGYSYYNCSDGAYIEGTVPLLAEFVDLPEPKMPKTQTVQKLLDSFPVYTKDLFQEKWQDGKLIQDVREIGDALIKVLEENPELGNRQYVSEIMKVMPPLAVDNAAMLVLRGGVFLLLIVCEYFLDRIEQQDKKAELEAYLAQKYCDLIDSMCNEVDVEFSSLQKTGKLVNRETQWN